jgi:hypothetical protein
MEKEYTLKINRANETIVQLQAHVQQLRAEKQQFVYQEFIHPCCYHIVFMNRLKEECQEQLTANTTRYEAELMSMKTQNHSTIRVTNGLFQRKVSSWQLSVRHLNKNCWLTKT